MSARNNKEKRMPKYSVPSTFTIPDTIDGVTALLTVRGWEKAAIVWAYTTDKRKSANTDRYGVFEFAALGITGLRNHETVQIYRDHWQAAIDAGVGAEVAPGDIITVPDLKWPPTDTDPRKGAERHVSRKDIDAAIKKRTPEEKAVMARELLEDPAVAEEVYRDPDQLDRAAQADHKSRARDRGIVDPRPERKPDKADSSSSPGTAVEPDDQRHFLDAIAHIADASIKLGQVADDLARLTLDRGQVAQVETRLDRLAAKLDMLRSCAMSGSIDDELAAMLAGGE